MARVENPGAAGGSQDEDFDEFRIGEHEMWREPTNEHDPPPVPRVSSSTTREQSEPDPAKGTRKYYAVVAFKEIKLVRRDGKGGLVVDNKLLQKGGKNLRPRRRPRKP